MMMMKLELIRQELPDKCVGQLRGLKQEYVTLEPPNRNNKPFVSCIPYGTYIVEPDDKGKWQYFTVTDVPNRTFIEIHPVSDVSQLEGCIAVGTGFVSGFALNYAESARACTTLKQQLTEPFILTIRPFVNDKDTWRAY